MDDEPTNAAAEIARYAVGRLNDEEWLRSKGLTLVTPDFVRYDRRRLRQQPPTDGKGWLADVMLLGEVSGKWPTFSVAAVVAVRGDRLVVYRLLISFDDSSEIEAVVLAQYEEQGERGELVMFFDPEGVDLAIAELDRLHDELTHG